MGIVARTARKIFWPVFIILFVLGFLVVFILVYKSIVGNYPLGLGNENQNLSARIESDRGQSPSISSRQPSPSLSALRY